MGTEALAIGGAVLGGIAGAEGEKTSLSNVSQKVSTVDAGPQGEFERLGEQASVDALKALQQQLADIQRNPAQARFASLLQEIGADPSQARIQQAQQFAQEVFRPQEIALQQNLEAQQQSFAARAAQLGRSTADPILAAKLAQEQVRQQQQLSAQRGAFAAQEAINAPTRQFQNLAAGVGSLEQRAIQNQSAIFGLGSSLAEQLRQFRLATATRTTFGSTQEDTQKGGGFGGALGGILSGAAGGVKLGGKLFG